MDCASCLENLKKSDVYVYVACTGAGAGLQNIIWSEPGISNVFVGSAFPYNKHETDAFLGFTPDKYASEETAMDMAIESFIRAKTAAYKEGKFDKKCIGLGVTASVASERVHRGDHVVHMFSISDDGFGKAQTTLTKREGRKARSKDGVQIDEWALYEIDYQLRKQFITDSFPTLDACFWSRPVFTINRRLKESSNNIKFPGNFNPPHAGHFDMAKRSSSAVGGKSVDYLININNPHKPHLSIIECLCRVAAFRAAEEFSTSANAVHFTKGQPLFVDKVSAFHTCKFIVGADTLQRILDPKWGVSTEKVIQQIYIKSLLFFERKNGENAITFHDVIKGLRWEDIRYLEDSILMKCGKSLPISSTQIREERKLDKIKQDDLWPVP